MGKKDSLENSSDERLDKEKLAQERKGEVEAGQLEPIGKESQHVEPCIEWVIR